jgi:hypothetical protein
MSINQEQFLNEILDRANINNIKYNKHDIKNISTFNDMTPDRSNQVAQSDLLARTSSSSPAAQDTEANGETVGHLVRSPSWKYVKLDLFDNATPEQLAKDKRVFNLKLAFLTHGRYKSVAAALNSSWKEVKRGFDFNLQEDLDHYQVLEDAYRLLCKSGLERVRASKCYEPVPGKQGKNQKGPTIYGMSVVMGMLPEGYFCILVDGTETYECHLTNKELSDLQRKNNCIATGHIGDVLRKQRKTRDDFFRD